MWTTFLPPAGLLTVRRQRFDLLDPSEDSDNVKLINARRWREGNHMFPDEAGRQVRVEEDYLLTVFSEGQPDRQCVCQEASPSPPSEDSSF